jgi:hypothetical protein
MAIGNAAGLLTIFKASPLIGTGAKFLTGVEAFSRHCDVGVAHANQIDFEIPFGNFIGSAFGGPCFCRRELRRRELRDACSSYAVICP